MSKIKFCKKCRDNNEPNFHGYFAFLKDDCYQCPVKDCRKQLIDIDFDNQDYLILLDISKDIDFIEAMIQLRDTDPIEYQLKLSQFKTQVKQQEIIEQTNMPKCPTCSSTNLKKISTTSKVANTAMWGILGTKRHKTFHCNSCGDRKSVV